MEPRRFVSIVAPRSAPALAAKAKDLESLRASVVDASTVSGTLWISYLFVLFYFLVAAGGVTHKDLLLESPVKLPFLNVDLPLKGFFWLGPLLFLILHTYVLLHFQILAGKVEAFDAELRRQITDRQTRTWLRRQLPTAIFVQLLAGPKEVRSGIVGRLLRLIAIISLVIGPVALLIFFLLQFLPYHSGWITWSQRIAVVLDLWLLWQLWPVLGRSDIGREGGRWRRLRRIIDVAGWRTRKRIAAMARRRQWVAETWQLRPIARGRLVLPVTAAVAVPLVFFIATYPGEWLDEVMTALHVPLRETLVVSQISSCNGPKACSRIALYCPGSMSLIIRSSTAMRRSKRYPLQLRCVDAICGEQF